jgi:hypothetical protein
MGTLSTIAAVAGVFFVCDLVYTLDHYFVHHDKARYAKTHARHHVRYGGAKSGLHLDAYELSTYGTAALMSIAPTSLLTLFTGNPGFLLGAALKFLHSLLFHLYQHGWWGPIHIRKLGIERPRWGIGIASARYHAFHHANPDDERFTYCESWKGFDRLLEWAHPWLVKYTVDGKNRIRKAAPPPSSAPASGERPAT